VSTAEALIVKGKEQGFLNPDDILQAFPDIDAEVDLLVRIFQVFRDMGIEVSDGDKDFEAVDDIDDETLAKAEAADAISLDDPVRMYLKEIGRVALVTAAQEVEHAKGIEAGKELVREGFSAHFVECDQYLAHADERPRLAAAVAESLPDRTRLLERRERRLVLAGVVKEEPAERFQRGRGLLPIAELRPTDDRLLQP